MDKDVDECSEAAQMFALMQGLDAEDYSDPTFEAVSELEDWLGIPLAKH